MNVFELVAKLVLDTSDYDKKLPEEKEKTERNFSGVGEAAKTGMKVVGAALAAATTAVVGFGKSSVEAGMTFDSTMSEVKAISGATASEFDQLRDKAQEMGATTKFTATEAADAMVYMGMAGWKADDMLSGIPGILNLAAASGEDLAITSDIVTDALTAFGMEAGEAGRFADILASTATNANTNVGLMGETFKYVAPVAGAMGYEAEDVAVAIGLMANSGIKASQAGTALRSIMTRMAKPTKESGAAMDALGLSLDDGHGHMYSFMEIMEQMREGFTKNLRIPQDEVTASMNELVGQYEDGLLTEKEYEKGLETLMDRAYGAEGALMAEYAAMLAGKTGMSGLLAIVNASDEDFAQLTQAIEESSDTMVRTADGSIMTLTEALESGAEVVEEFNGAAEAMAVTMQDNLQGDVISLKSALEGLKISISDRLTPSLRDFVQFGRDGVRKLTVEFKENGLQGALNALGPVIDKGISLIFSKLPQVLEAAIKLLEAFVNAIINNLPKLIPAAIQIIQSLVQSIVANLPMLLDATVQIIMALADGIIKSLPVLIPAIIEIVLIIVEKLTEPSTLMQLIQAAFQIIGAVAEGLIKAIPKIVEAVPTIIMNLIEAILRFLPQLLASGVQLMTELALGITQGAVEVIGAIVKLLKEIPEKFKERINDAKSWGKDMIQGFLDGIKEKWNDLKKAVSDTAQKIKDFLGFSKPKEGPLSDADTYGGDFIQLFISGINKAKGDLLKTVKDTAKGVFEAIKNTWNTAKTLGENFLNNIANGISSRYSNLSEKVQKIGERIREYWDKFKETAKTLGSNVLVGFTNGIVSKVSGLYEKITHIRENVRDRFRALAESAKSWGRDLMTSFVNGVIEKFNALKSTISDVANSVKRRLGFSEPEEGPLSDFHTYAPDMMKLFAKGIKDNEHLITDQIDKSFDLGDRFWSTVPNAISVNGGSNSSNDNRTFVINLECDKTQFARLIYKLNDEESQRVGVRLARGMA